MRWWIHAQRSRHQRSMAEADSHLAWAEYLRLKDDPVKGWIHVEQAIRLVMDCGCPRRLWPDQVQAGIPEVTDG